MVKKKKYFKYSQLEMIGEYTWVIGLSLIVVGASKLYGNAKGILYTGIIIYLISVAIKSSLPSEFAEINRKLNILIRRVKK